MWGDEEEDPELYFRRTRNINRYFGIKQCPNARRCLAWSVRSRQRCKNCKIVGNNYFCDTHQKMFSDELDAQMTDGYVRRFHKGSLRLWRDPHDGGSLSPPDDDDEGEQRTEVEVEGQLEREGPSVTGYPIIFRT